MDHEDLIDQDETDRIYLDIRASNPELASRADNGDIEAKRKLTQIYSSRKYRANKKINEKKMELELEELRRKNLELKTEKKRMEEELEKIEKEHSGMIAYLGSIIESIKRSSPFSGLFGFGRNQDPT